MSGTKPSLKTLQIRKELLIAEAELLRAQLGHDLEIIHQGFEGLGAKAKSVASYASIITTILAGVSEFRRVRKTQVQSQPSFLGTLLSGIRTASAIWGTLRSNRD